MRIRTAAPLAAVALSLGGVLLPAPAGAAPPGDQVASFPYVKGVSEHLFTVPADVCEITIELHGASGGNSTFEGALAGGGKGGSVSATMPVAPGTVLTVVPGSQGGPTNWDLVDPSPFFQSIQGGAGGFNGGGNGGTAGSYHVDETEWMGGGAGGGGASDIRLSSAVADRFLVAGGGGGAGIGVLPPQNTSTAYVAGDGGNPGEDAEPGQAPAVGGGGGAPSSGGGTAGVGGGPNAEPTAGTSFQGGKGGGGIDTGDATQQAWDFGGGGGGGGASAGGGGGAWSAATGTSVSAGGGGGSSDEASSQAGLGLANVTYTTGDWTGNGRVEIGYTPDPGCAEVVPLGNPRVAGLYAGLLAAGIAGAFVLHRRRRPVVG